MIVYANDLVDESMQMQDMIENLTLLLIYLTSWEDTIHKDLPGEQRAWKQYNFEILNLLEEKGFITQSKNAKSLYLTGKGLTQAERLKGLLKIVQEGYRS